MGFSDLKLLRGALSVLELNLQHIENGEDDHSLWSERALCYEEGQNLSMSQDMKKGQCTARVRDNSKMFYIS